MFKKLGRDVYEFFFLESLKHEKIHWVKKKSFGIKNITCEPDE